MEKKKTKNHRSKTPVGVSINPLVSPDPESKFGPAMSVLSERQQAFVMAMITLGTMNHIEAAKAAGYGQGTKYNIRFYAYRLAHDEKIQAAISEESSRRLNSGKPMAVAGLLKMAEDGDLEPQYRLKAFEMVMNRTGLHATTEQKVQMTYKDETSEEMTKQITLIAQQLGVDASKLLGAPTVDAEFTEVKDGKSGEETQPR
jgi:hypothetical protein